MSSSRRLNSHFLILLVRDNSELASTYIDREPWNKGYIDIYTLVLNFMTTATYAHSVLRPVSVVFKGYSVIEQ